MVELHKRPICFVDILRWIARAPHASYATRVLIALVPQGVSKGWCSEPSSAFVGVVMTHPLKVIAKRILLSQKEFVRAAMQAQKGVELTYYLLAQRLDHSHRRFPYCSVSGNVLYNILCGKGT
jgi:hypothetical protein